MILASRPIRFFLLTLGGWAGIRMVLLWPAALLPPIVRAIAPEAEAATPAGTPTVLPEPPLTRFIAPASTSLLRNGDRLGRIAATMPSEVNRFDPFAIAPKSSNTPAPGPVSASPGTDPPTIFDHDTRWSVSAWAILRPVGTGAPFTSQLGGSQAGARFAYAIDRERRIAVYARVASAIQVVQHEAAVGIDWKPTRLPVHVIAEQRFGIEGARGGATLGAVGGIGPTAIAAGLRVEAYGQAGIIVRDGHEAYVDGAVRVTRPVAPRLDLGAGIWGAAQRDAARLDVGPTIGVTVPVDRRTLRLSIDWRQRIGGSSRPGSGPAISLGTDF